MSNDNREIQNNDAEKERGISFTPNPVENRGFSSTPKTVKVTMSRSFCKTPVCKSRKSNQESAIGNSVTHASPNQKSRLDFSSAPDINIDIEAYRAEIQRLEQEHKSLLLVEKQIMTHEWTKAKKRAKFQQEYEIREHERLTVKNGNQLRQMMQKREKDNRIEGQIIKKQEFFALVDAKKKMKDEEKRKEKDRIRIDREKSLKIRKENEDRKEKEKCEQTEKRKAFVESVEVAKAAEHLEKIRQKREKDFEVASDLAGRCKVLQDHCSNQRLIIEKTESLIFN